MYVALIPDHHFGSIFCTSLLYLQQDSDTEWKFGLAKLIRNMHRTDASPAPINLITTWTVYIYQACKSEYHAL